MKLTSSIKIGIHVLSLEEDELIREKLEQYCYKALHDKNFKGIVLNLKNIETLNSLRVGVIMSLLELLDKNEKKLAICHLRGKLPKILTNLF